MTTNAAVLENAYAAWLTYVTTHADFLALGCKVFSAPSGSPIPLREDGSLGTTEIPAFYVETCRPKWSDWENDNSRRQYLLEIEVSGGLLYTSTSTASPNPVFAAAAALLTLCDVLGSSTAQQGALAGTANIDDYDFSPGDVIPVIDKSNPRLVRYWDAQFSVTLKKLVTFA